MVVLELSLMVFSGCLESDLKVFGGCLTRVSGKVLLGLQIFNMYGWVKTGLVSSCLDMSGRNIFTKNF